MKNNILLFLSLFSSIAMLDSAESPAKRRKLFDLPPVVENVHVEEIPDTQLIECRYCSEQCAGFEMEKKHALKAHNTIISEIRFEGRGIRYELPPIDRFIRRYRQIVPPTPSGSSSDDDDYVR